VCRLAFALAHLPAIAFQVLLDELHATDHSTASLPVIERRQHEHTPATAACQPPDTLTRPRHARSAAGVPSGLRPGPLAGDCLPGAARHWRRRRFEASFTDREDEDPAELPDELHALTTAPPARATPAATLAHACNRCLPANRHLDQATARPIGCRCAVSPSPWPACRRLPSRHRSTLAPLSLRGRFHRSRERRPGSTAGDRAPRDPDQATARPIGCRCAVWPSPWLTCRRSPSRCCSMSCTPLTTAPPARAHACNRGLPATRHHDQATARPIGCRCAVSPSPWPACRRSPSRYCSTLAPSSPRGRLHRSREQRPGRTAGDRAPPQHGPRHGTPDRLPVCRLAFALARLPAIAFQVLLDAGAVVASWPVSPIERTKTRPELPAIEHRQHGLRRRQPWHTSATDACQQPDTLTTPQHARFGG
jgi:hypothetical protein